VTTINKAALPLQSSRMEKRAVVFLWAEGHNANAIHSEMRPGYANKWPDKENAGWTKICFRYGGAMGRSSVSCAAADFVFLHGAFTKLFKDKANV